MDADGCAFVADLQLFDGSLNRLAGKGYRLEIG
jgi:hypothetical protein